MKRTPVLSTVFESIGYAKDYGTLEVELLNGAVYQYYDVPESTYSELMASAYREAYFDQYIKHGEYRYRKVA